MTQGVTPRITARFPQAWINNNAIDVDLEGDDEWDASEEFAKISEDYRTHLLAEMGAKGDALDAHDRLREDPNAPEWVRKWQGPFSIRVRFNDEDEVVESVGEFEARRLWRACGHLLYENGRPVAYCTEQSSIEHDHGFTQANLTDLYAVTPEPGCGPDEPLPAAFWFYQCGDAWMAVTEHESEDDWFDDNSSWPTPRTYPITQVPPYGTLCFRLADGRVADGVVVNAERVAPTTHDNCSCADHGPLFHLAQRMEEVLVAQRSGHWSPDWEHARDAVLEDYDTWRQVQ